MRQKIRDLSISWKMGLGFGLVIAIVIGLCAYEIVVLNRLSNLEDEMQAQYAEATAAREIAAAAKTKLDLLYVAQTRYAASVAAQKVTEIKNIRTMQAQSNTLGRVLAARAKAARAKAAREIRADGAFSPTAAR